MNPLNCSALLLRTPGDRGPGLTGMATAFAAAGVPFEIEPLFSTAVPDAPALAAAPGRGAQWHVARPTQSLEGANAWELAHAALQRGLALDAGGGGIFVEPDFVQDWPADQPAADAPALGIAGPDCRFEDQKKGLPGVADRFAWHLDDDYSQLRSARRDAGTPAPGARVRIMHLDTGYDRGHQAFRDARIRPDLERNFLVRPPGRDAIDPGIAGFLDAPGHGTGTLGILAGGRFAFAGNGYAFDDMLGGAPEAEVVPVRVGNALIQISTSSVAAGLAYAADLAADATKRAHVISMSMGGVASRAWAEAVNKVYETGIVLVAAAGNNYSAGVFGLPTRFIVYPARFRRAIAACGVMADFRAYYGLKVGMMQGNWGPGSKMATALAAFTPNIAWAKWGCKDTVRMSGQGTSSATPQIAAAAALYHQKHFATLFDARRYPEPWMRVEAVRHGLFAGADKSAGNEEQFGQGVLRAVKALEIAPAARESLRKSPGDNPAFSFLRVLTGLGVTESPSDAMLSLEATQLSQRSWGEGEINPFELMGVDPDLPASEIPRGQQRRLIEALIEHPEASAPLRERLRIAHAALGEGSGAPKPPGPKPAGPRDSPPPARPPVPEPPRAEPAAKLSRFTPGEPPFRRLRGFTIDPSLATRLDTAPISQVEFRVPWEKLAPGPCGEYLEVIDIDPGSGCCYEPVDLDDPRLLAQGGLPPGEGTPQFHQQMVYAVASLTIRNFESALGRRALWRAGPPPAGAHPKNDSRHVQRLRIHPHALRERNAYYTPNKVALLFGYFRASADAPGEHLPGGMVFTCLSHDIIAHETTHALLDGMHRRFLRPTNPDVHAFHEAFADIVALFQHFTFPEIVRHQINATRGAIRSQQNMLGQLAGEFGRATGRRGALRDAIGTMENGQWVPAKPDPGAYEKSDGPHQRGAHLVAAVFDAFLSIYETRTRDLIRLATGGTGVLQHGEIHPDLAERLSREAAKSAAHVLAMCVRALDYCPPTDITFGEYLRAIITADYDLVPNDDLNYRIAFVEAFRRRGIFPRGVLALSVESLRWLAADEDVQPHSPRMAAGLEMLRRDAQEHMYAGSREEIFHLQRALRSKLHDWLEDHFASGAAGLQDAAFLGLDPAKSFEVHTARFAHRVGPDGEMKPQILIGLLQDTAVPLDSRQPDGGQMLVEGGCTIVADLRSRRIGYCIRKSIGSASRQARQRRFLAGDESLRATYFGAQSPDEHHEPFAALHRGD
jgi:hypothetical protein